MEEYKIDSDIIVPEKRNTRWAKLSRQMVEGDSVLVGTMIEAHGLYTAIKRLGHARRIRIDGEGFRVWKLEKLED